GNILFSGEGRHARFKWDWSAAVCSPDLGRGRGTAPCSPSVGSRPSSAARSHAPARRQASISSTWRDAMEKMSGPTTFADSRPDQIGRASGRERGRDAVEPRPVHTYKREG